MSVRLTSKCVTARIDCGPMAYIQTPWLFICATTSAAVPRLRVDVEDDDVGVDLRRTQLEAWDTRVTASARILAWA